MRPMPKRSARPRSGRPCGSWRRRAQRRKPRASSSAPETSWFARGQLINALRGHLAEFGHVVAKGPAHVARLVELVRDPSSGLPEEARSVLLVAAESLEALKAQITVLDRQIEARAKASALARRLMTIP